MNKYILVFTKLLIVVCLILDRGYTCISEEYNDAYSLFKNGQYSESINKFNNLNNKGCPLSSFFLGIYYTYGIGINQDLEQATYYLNKFLDINNLAQPRDYREQAYCALSFIYKEKLEIEKSLYYLLQAANMGNKEAQYILGISYLSDIEPYHLQKNFKASFYWLKQLAISGNIDAMKLIDKCSLHNYKIT